MLEHVVEFINIIISYGGFKRSDFYTGVTQSIKTAENKVLF